ncbi:hypothetical protein ACFDR9_002701 [Janthinobacterium sp. CG_23.3]|uniref:transglycosylase SLT domain-containing protein n=1 Tax=Janthinobacterium sp. CG_23.3 TaxID=3349634 RepID=UPI0038D4E0C7
MNNPRMLSWADKPVRKPWSEQLLASVAAAKNTLDLGNPEGFVAGYSTLSLEHQLKFWAELLVAIAWRESAWEPTAIYHEPAPLGIDSVGLLQLSYEDAVNYTLEPLDRAAKSLEQPLVNLRCAVVIMASLVSRDKVVASSSRNRHAGGARYWSVLRKGHHIVEIQAKVKTAMGL